MPYEKSYYRRVERPQRTIRHVLDTEILTVGIPIVIVPLQDVEDPACAILNQVDFDTIIALGASEIWSLNQDGKVQVWATKAKRNVLIDRLIMDAGPGEAVYHRDRNPCNLRKTNLVISDHPFASTRDREHVAETWRNFNRIIHSWEYMPPKIGYNRLLPQQPQQYNYDTSFEVKVKREIPATYSWTN